MIRQGRFTNTTLGSGTLKPGSVFRRVEEPLFAEFTADSLVIPAGINFVQATVFVGGDISMSSGNARFYVEPEFLLDKRDMVALGTLVDDVTGWRDVRVLGDSLAFEEWTGLERFGVSYFAELKIRDQDPTDNDLARGILLPWLVPEYRRVRWRLGDCRDSRQSLPEPRSRQHLSVRCVRAAREVLLLPLPQSGQRHFHGRLPTPSD
jgi:hypothetical protein